MIRTMSESSDYDVVLSHSAKDKAVVRPLANAMTNSYCSAASD